MGARGRECSRTAPLPPLRFPPTPYALTLIFERGLGFRLDPKEEEAADDLERRILDDSGGWRTVKEWATVLRIRETGAKDILERLVASSHVETKIGPAGRSPKAHCYRTAPVSSAQSDAVTQSPTRKPLTPLRWGTKGVSFAPSSPGNISDSRTSPWCRLSVKQMRPAARNVHPIGLGSSRGGGSREAPATRSRRSKRAIRTARGRGRRRRRR